MEQIVGICGLWQCFPMCDAISIDEDAALPTNCGKISEHTKTFSGKFVMVWKKGNWKFVFRVKLAPEGIWQQQFHWVRPFSFCTYIRVSGGVKYIYNELNYTDWSSST